MQLVTLETQRLRLRPWKDADYAPFAALNSDPEVMEFFPRLLSPKEADALVDKIKHFFQKHGFGLWAVDVKDTFIGFIGLNIPTFDAHFMPAMEIGWRLARPYWGHGYATEGATEVLRFAFEVLQQEEIVAFTASQNVRSQRVMERIGMRHDPDDDFEHTMLHETNPLRQHVLFRITRAQWFEQR